MAANRKNILTRYFFILVMMAAVGVAVVVKAGIIMFLERDYWHQVDQRRVKNNIVKPAARGNILSTDGKLMSSSIPEYKVYLDEEEKAKYRGVPSNCSRILQGFRAPCA